MESADRVQYMFTHSFSFFCYQIDLFLLRMCAHTMLHIFVLLHTLMDFQEQQTHTFTYFESPFTKHSMMLYKSNGWKDSILFRLML